MTLRRVVRMSGDEELEMLRRRLIDWTDIGARLSRDLGEANIRIKELEAKLADRDAETAEWHSLVASQARMFFNDSSIIPRMRELVDLATSAEMFVRGVDRGNDQHRLDYREFLRRMHDLELTKPRVFLELLSAISKAEGKNGRVHIHNTAAGTDAVEQDN